MKKLQVSLIALALAFAAVSCKKNETDATLTKEKQEVAAKTGEEFKADTVASVVKWHATHKGGFAPRFGTLKLSEGEVTVENGTITGGDFVIDINSLKTDPASVTEADKKPEDLDNHLKSPDFFDAAKYPTAKFEITSVAPFDAAKDQSTIEGATNIISGNLTLKDKTVNVSFPAKVTTTATDVTLAAKFTVDRTAWNLTYGAEGDPKDWTISKDFDIELAVTAKK